jgi:hypothetical protein
VIVGSNPTLSAIDSKTPEWSSARGFYIFVCGFGIRCR